jgi:hypothetical protein
MEELVLGVGASLRLGESLQGAVVSSLPGLDSLSDQATWALVPRDEFVSSSVKDATRGLSATSMQGVLEERARNYQLASVAETVVAALHDLADGGKLPGFLKMCRDTTVGSEPLCVQYDSKARIFTIGVPTDFAISEVEPAFSYHFRN